MLKEKQIIELKKLQNIKKNKAKKRFNLMMKIKLLLK